MYLMMISIFILLLLTIFMMLLNFFIMKKKLNDREKITPFECGFNPITSSRLPFSINFYLVMMIFLIFDIEVVILLPMIYFLDIFNKNFIYAIIFIMMILIIGIYYEWMDNSINWVF